jgi:hypothetical protein
VNDGFVIVRSFAELNTLDVVRRIEDEMVVDGHILRTPRLAPRFRHPGELLPAARLELQEAGHVARRVSVECEEQSDE